MVLKDAEQRLVTLRSNLQKVTPNDAEGSRCYSMIKHSEGQEDGLALFSYFLTLMSFFLCHIRSNRDLHGGERSGEPVWGEQRVVCRNEQPWEVIRNGRYAHYFIYCGR